MKASMRNDKGSCNHNDRSFKTADAEHIQGGAVYAWTMDKDGQWQDCPLGQYEMERREKERYKELFGQHFDQVNAKYREQGHGEKCKSLKQHRKGRHAPIEAIFQIGKDGEWTDANALLTAVNGTLADMQDKLGDNMVPLSIAVHCDETSLHAHVRWCIVAHDREGHLMPDKENGLMEAGIDLPQSDQPKSRDNCRLIAFTDWQRDRWYDKVDEQLKEYGLTIDRVTDPKNRSRRNKKTQQHRAEELGERVVALQQQLESVEAARDRAVARVQELTEAIEEMEPLRYEAAMELIQEQGLEEELEEKIKSKAFDYDYDF